MLYVYAQGCDGFNVIKKHSQMLKTQTVITTSVSCEVLCVFAAENWR